jgi:hypothetical protein
MMTYRNSAHSNELTIMDDLLNCYSRYRSRDILKSQFLNFSINLHGGPLGLEARLLVNTFIVLKTIYAEEYQWDFWSHQLVVYNVHTKPSSPSTVLQPSIKLVKKDFVPWGKMSVFDLFLDAEFKHVPKISLSPTAFALHQAVWKHRPTYVRPWGPVGRSLDML